MPIKEIEKSERQRITTQEHIEKWMQILIIPILLAVFSVIINGQTDLEILLEYTIVFFIILGSIACMLFNCYNFLGFYKKRKLEQMKSFYSDLQGILDFQFDNKLLFKNDNSKGSKDNIYRIKKSYMSRKVLQCSRNCRKKKLRKTPIIYWLR